MKSITIAASAMMLSTLVLGSLVNDSASAAKKNSVKIDAIYQVQKKISGKAAKGAKVQIINAKTGKVVKTVKVKNNGKFSAKLSKKQLKLKTKYKISVTKKGYKKVVKNATVKYLNKATTKNNPIYSGEKKVAGVALDINGKAIKGAKIQVKVAGKTVTTKTNNKGQFSVKHSSVAGTRKVSIKAVKKNYQAPKRSVHTQSFSVSHFGATAGQNSLKVNVPKKGTATLYNGNQKLATSTKSGVQTLKWTQDLPAGTKLTLKVTSTAKYHTGSKYSITKNLTIQKGVFIGQPHYSKAIMNEGAAQQGVEGTIAKGTKIGYFVDGKQVHTQTVGANGHFSFWTSGLKEGQILKLIFTDPMTKGTRTASFTVTAKEATPDVAKKQYLVKKFVANPAGLDIVLADETKAKAEPVHLKLGDEINVEFGNNQFVQYTDPKTNEVYEGQIGSPANDLSDVDPIVAEGTLLFGSDAKDESVDARSITTTIENEDGQLTNIKNAFGQVLFITDDGKQVYVNVDAAHAAASPFVMVVDEAPIVARAAVASNNVSILSNISIADMMTSVSNLANAMTPTITVAGDTITVDAVSSTDLGKAKDKAVAMSGILDKLATATAGKTVASTKVVETIEKGQGIVKDTANSGTITAAEGVFSEQLEATVAATNTMVATVETVGFHDNLVETKAVMQAIADVAGPAIIAANIVTDTDLDVQALLIETVNNVVATVSANNSTANELVDLVKTATAQVVEANLPDEEKVAGTGAADNSVTNNTDATTALDGVKAAAVAVAETATQANVAAGASTTVVSDVVETAKPKVTISSHFHNSDIAKAVAAANGKEITAEWDDAFATVSNLDLSAVNWSHHQNIVRDFATLDLNNANISFAGADWTGLSVGQVASAMAALDYAKGKMSNVDLSGVKINTAQIKEMMKTSINLGAVNANVTGMKIFNSKNEEVKGATRTAYIQQAITGLGITGTVTGK